MNPLAPTPSEKAVIFDLQRTCLHDGPGIRTTVFVKGCPLHCAWCHNPESQSFEPEWMVGRQPGDPPKLAGREMSVEAVMAIVQEDQAYYEASGGGITVSGGEPMASFRFTQALLQAAKAAGIHTCLDTSGAAPAERYRAIAPWVDVFLWDVKLSERACSLRLVGAAPEILWAGLRAVGGDGAQAILRCPIIPQLNDADSHFDAIAHLANEVEGVRGIHLIPYHRLGRSKRERLGRSDDFTAGSPDARTLTVWTHALQSRTPKPVTRG